jgi:hypothetical protein
MFFNLAFGAFGANLEEIVIPKDIDAIMNDASLSTGEKYNKLLTYRKNKILELTNYFIDNDLETAKSRYGVFSPGTSVTKLDSNGLPQTYILTIEDIKAQVYYKLDVENDFYSFYPNYAAALLDLDKKIKEETLKTETGIQTFKSGVSLSKFDIYNTIADKYGDKLSYQDQETVRDILIMKSDDEVSFSDGITIFKILGPYLAPDEAAKLGESFISVYYPRSFNWSWEKSPNEIDEKLSYLFSKIGNFLSQEEKDAFIQYGNLTKKMTVGSTLTPEEMNIAQALFKKTEDAMQNAINKFSIDSASYVKSLYGIYPSLDISSNIAESDKIKTQNLINLMNQSPSTFDTLVLSDKQIENIASHQEEKKGGNIWLWALLLSGYAMSRRNR